MNTISDLNASYIAGLTDGEGCLAIIRQRNKNCRGGYAYRCGFRISSSDSQILYWLREIVGSGCVKSHQPKMRNSKRQWAWEVWGPDALSLVKQLRPFMRIRAKQADLLLKFQTAIKIRQASHLTDAEITFREDCYHQSRALNQRGALPYERKIAT